MRTRLLTTSARPVHPPEPTAAHARAVVHGAARVLRANWTGASTVPSRRLYPHQWSWDSAFVAIGLRHLDPARARRELRSLFAAQWDDGRVPHIVFHPDVPEGAYFPGPGFWRSSTAGAAHGAPRSAETSGIVQPPVHALAAWLVHRADPAGAEREGFLAALHRPLLAWQRYLTEGRDLGGGGLASIVHPWESGMDNSPAWDAPLARVTPADPDGFRRADLDHGSADDRPTDLDYGRYVALAAAYRDHGYDDRSADAARRFAVEDPGFNALLIASDHALAEIAAALGRDDTGHRAAAGARTDALLHRLWNERTGLFHARDLHDDRLLPARGAAGLLPLIVPSLPAATAERLHRTLTGPHFGLGAGCRMVPSHDLLAPEYDAARYWRGPAWFNIAWLVERGLRLHGARRTADDLRTAAVTTAAGSGFAEYLDPRSLGAHGARDFSWTAALAVDLAAAVLADHGTPLPSATPARAPAAAPPTAPPSGHPTVPHLRTPVRNRPRPGAPTGSGTAGGPGTAGGHPAPPHPATGD
ncbi:MGH1-like glycoside hydrolase domain-containing protein [Streptomyces bohaiensis]|uniref:MGH1-like glycoside hydrolase domain-containing protein n=1 Tax=Streptomyces bohaiensis TaxID=1431344 RepID=UPI003B81893E